MTITASVSRVDTSGHQPPPLGVSVSAEESSVWVIEVRGDLDLYTGPMLKQHVKVPDPGGNGAHPRSVVYLLPEVEFIDASGLHALLAAVDGHGPETITIREPSSQVRRLLELVGLDAMIDERANR